jgi:hypothetical protein
MMLVLLLAACTEDARPGPVEDATPDAPLPDTADPDTDRDGTVDSEDCAPDDSSIHPGAPETCNGQDDDCDGEIDNSPVDPTRFYLDLDGDGFAGAEETVLACTAPENGHPEPLDCDDTNRRVHPDATEICDSRNIDEDCDGLSDDADPSVTNRTGFVPDADADGYGDETAPLQEWCDPPLGLLYDRTDCDDRDPDTHPGASESGISLWEDQACDGVGGNLSRADLRFVSDAPGEFSGFTVRGVGDVDGDGLVDLMVGDTFHEDSGWRAGRVFLVFGRTIAASTTTPFSLRDADITFLAEAGQDYLGYGISSAGDVDGDGLDDILLGAPGNNSGGPGSGKAYLFLGRSLAGAPSATVDVGEADLSFIGETPGDNAGFEVSFVGDVDGDGRAELLIGAYGSDDGGRDAGKSYLFFGATVAASTSTELDLSEADMAFVGEELNDWSGYIVRSAGDLDGDGLDDIIIGAPGPDLENATSYVMLGSTLAERSATTIDLSDADIIIHGEWESDSSGDRIASAGDVDGDGLDDLLFGLPYANEGGRSAGKVLLLLGSTLAASTSTSIDLGSADFSFIGEGEFDYVSETSSAGDVDGDGLDDILIASPFSGVGKIYIMFGASLTGPPGTSIELADADVLFSGQSSAHFAGGSMTTPGDVNGDGLDDIFIGSWGDAALAHVVYGAR